MKQKTTALLIILIILTGLLIVLSSIVELPPTVKSLAWPLLLLVTVVLIGITVWQFILQKDTEQPQLARESQNSQRRLVRVHAFWITGVLERSLHGAALIALGLHEQPDAIDDPWKLVLQQIGRAAQPLPPKVVLKKGMR